MAPRKKSIIFPLVKNILLLAVLGGVGYYAYTTIRHERKVIEGMNQAASAVTAGDYQKAIDRYQRVLAVLNPAKEKEKIQMVKSDLARCHMVLAEDPGRPLSESLKHYREAEKHVPGIIEDPMISKLLKRQAD